jgi:hypothetical protein
VGSGVLGPVFRTSDPRRSDLVAIKAFRLDLRPDQVVRLAEALRRLAASPPEHRFLPTVVDAGLEDTTPFLATEYLIGDTLDVVLRRRAPLPLAEALKLLAPVAEALDAAWNGGAGHGTLHPRDVFIRSDGDGIKVTGVGVLQAIERAGLAAPLRRPYSAPERGGPIWDRRSDVYSLGVIAHELLTGRRPAGATEQDGVFASEVTPEQRVALRRVLSKALAEQPDERYTSGLALVESLSAADGPVAVGRPLAVTPVELSIDAGPTREVTTDLVLPSTETVDAMLTRGTPNAGPDVDDDETASLRRNTASAGRADTGRDGFRRADPLDDLAYRPVEAAERVPGEWPAEADARAPLWMTADAAPASWRWPRWGLVVLVCLILGGGVGYFAATYDPLAEPEPTQVADRQIVTPPQPDVPPAAAPDPIPPPGVDAPAAAAPAPAPPRRQEPVRAAAPAPPASGALEVRSEPAGAMVTLDGRLVGETPLVLRDLTAGPYLLQVARPGYAPHSERVTIPAGGPERTVSVALEAGVTSPATVLGAIEVDSEPRGARVIVDGRYVGQSPLRVLELRPGPHSVTLELANHASLTRRAIVEPGKTVKVIVNLR